MNSVWNLLTGTATRYLLLAVTIVVGVFLMPYTIRHLGTSEYGLWMLVASMTAYFNLLDLGYGSGLVRHVADADARGDTTLVNQILSTFVVVYLALGVFVGLAAAVLVLWVPRFPRLLPSQVPLAQYILAVIGVRIALGFPMTIFGAVTTARQRFALNNLVATASAIVNAAVQFTLLARGHHVRAVVAGSVCVDLLTYVGYAWTAKRAFPELRLRASAFRTSLIREVTAFSLYFFLISIAVQIGFNLDNVVVGAALGTSAVAVYAVTLRLADAQRNLSNQFNTLMFPVVVRYGAINQTGALRTMLIEGTRLSLTLVCGLTVCLVGFAQPLILRWMGPGFDAAVAPLDVLAVTGIVLIGQAPLGNVLLGTGRHRLVAFVSLGEAIVNLALSVILVRRFGLLGVAIGTAIPVFVANLFVLVPVVCRELDVRITSFVHAVTIAPLIGSSVCACAVWALRAMWPPHSLVAILVEGAIAGLIYLAALWTLGLDAALRERYSTLARRLLAWAADHRLAARLV
ncbi:MAG TPA: polysaccharide biosynthesis C-terminal domain-containing protein [Vicinamibacterales bacterium]|nr:polysaccharide biosynthesis C-terminal domain-containing protein [Vicinamibacterales bacterium]